MKITVLAIGSRGDVQPLVGLAKGLKKAGFEVRIATHPNFKEMVENEGLEFFLIAIDIAKVLQSQEGQASMGSGNPIKSIRAFAKLMHPYMVKMSEGCWDACQGAQAILSGTFGSYVVPHINEKLKLPVIKVRLQPDQMTGRFPSYLVSPERRLPGFLNRFTWWIYEVLHWLPLKSAINDFRVNSLGLKKLPWNQVQSRKFKDRTTLCLYGYSAELSAKPSDWASNIHITGFWFLDLGSEYKPPEDLMNFLNNGPPPIYVGFGSMSTRSSKDTAHTIIKSLSDAGQRGILAKEWGGIMANDIPDNIFLIEAAPHDWLFKHVSAVSHHCGAGTTAAGIRAGVPTIPVPHYEDQPFWSDRLYKQGVSTKPIPHAELSLELLSHAVNEVVGNEELKSKASQMGEKIRAEDGVKNAVQLIDDYLNKK